MRRLTTVFAVLTLGLTLAACGGDEETDATPSPSASETHGDGHSDEPTEEPPMTEEPSPTEEPAPEGTVIEVEFAAGAVTPDTLVYDVALGDKVTLLITSDIADEVHVHGYDKEFELEAGAQATYTFTANIPGVFEVETHHDGVVLYELRVS